MTSFLSFFPFSYPSSVTIFSSMVILHVITGLGSGGAENMLYRHIKALDGFNILLFHSSSGHYGQKFNDLGVLCYSLTKDAISFLSLEY